MLGVEVRVYLLRDLHAGVPHLIARRQDVDAGHVEQGVQNVCRNSCILADAVEIAHIMQRSQNNAAFLHKLLVWAENLEDLYCPKPSRPKD